MQVAPSRAAWAAGPSNQMSSQMVMARRSLPNSNTQL